MNTQTLMSNINVDRNGIENNLFFLPRNKSSCRLLSSEFHEELTLPYWTKTQIIFIDVTVRLKLHTDVAVSEQNCTRKTKTIICTNT